MPSSREQISSQVPQESTNDGVRLPGMSYRETPTSLLAEGGGGRCLASAIARGQSDDDTYYSIFLWNLIDFICEVKHSRRRVFLFIVLVRGVGILIVRPLPDLLPFCVAHSPSSSSLISSASFFQSGSRYSSGYWLKRPSRCPQRIPPPS